jgi:hypothetical protein
MCGPRPFRFANKTLHIVYILYYLVKKINYVTLQCALISSLSLCLSLSLSLSLYIYIYIYKTLLKAEYVPKEFFVTHSLYIILYYLVKKINHLTLQYALISFIYIYMYI